MFAKYIFLLLHFCTWALLDTALWLDATFGGAQYKSRKVFSVSTTLHGPQQAADRCRTGLLLANRSSSTSGTFRAPVLAWVFDPCPLLNSLLLTSWVKGKREKSASSLQWVGEATPGSGALQGPLCQTHEQVSCMCSRRGGGHNPGSPPCPPPGTGVAQSPANPRGELACCGC